MKQAKVIVIGAGVSGLADPALAPAGQLGLYVLTPVPNRKDGSSLDWTDPDQLAARRARIFARIRQITPLTEFEKHIIFEKVYSPADWESGFNAKYGATFGLRTTLLQSNYWRPQTKAWHYENLYFTGGSVRPGAGVPIVLTSAKLAANDLIRDARL